VDYVGRVNRTTKQEGREALNSSYTEFCRKTGRTVPSAYRMVFPNITAGFRSAAKYDKGQPELDEEAWALAGDWTKQHFHPAMCGSEVLGQDFVLEEMDKTTSCGYPWNLKYQKKTDMLASEAKQVLPDYWDQLALETPVPVIWTCSQKRELREIQKLNEGKHRTFTASPIEHSVALNRVCLDMNNKFYAGGEKTWSFVGTTKFLQGWDRLYNRLNRLPCAFELDESEYDSSLFARAMFGQRDIRWSMLRAEDQTPENARRLDNLYEAIVHSVIVLENGELVQKHTGNPSGSSNTIVDNTMILFRLFAYAWIILGRENDVGTYASFMLNVEAALNGDDNTFTTSVSASKWFNPTTIGPLWSSIGVITKTPCDTPRELKDVRFLSQGFVWSEKLGIWLPTPESNRVLSSVYAGSSVDDVRWHYLRASALRLDSYGNEECRVTLQAYIEYLEHNYSDQFFGEVRGLTMSEIRNVWKSDSYIEALYSGQEGVAIESTSPFKSHHQLSEFLSSDHCPAFECKQSMPKTAAQRAARRRRRHAKKGGKSVAIVPISGHGAYRPTRYNRVSGHGGYLSDLGRGLGSAAGGLLGGLGGIADTGIDLVKGLGSMVSGSGKYRSRKRIGSHPSSRGGSKMSAAAASAVSMWPFVNGGALNMGSASPEFNGGSPRIRHREYIGPVYSSDIFTTTSYRIQPGLSGTSTLFPWGSSVAGCFQQYQLNGMILEYVSTSSNFSAVTGLGSVMLSTLYDANATPLATLSAVKNNDFTTSEAPDKSFVHPIECASNASPLVTRYVRTNNTSEDSTTDDRLDDVGLFQVSIAGGPTSANGVQIGELWSIYDMTLMKSALPDIHVGTTALASASSTSLTSSATPIPWTLVPSSSLPVAFDSGTTGATPEASQVRVIMPAGYNGNYLLVAYSNVQTGSTPSGNIIGISSGSDITAVTAFNFQGTQVDGASAGSGSQNCIFVFAFSTIAEGGSATVPANNWIKMSQYYTTTTSNLTVQNMIITALDNDVTAAISLLGFQGRFNPKASAAILGKQEVALRTLQSQVEALMKRLGVSNVELRDPLPVGCVEVDEQETIALGPGDPHVMAYVPQPQPPPSPVTGELVEAEESGPGMSSGVSCSAPPKLKVRV